MANSSRSLLGTVLGLTSLLLALTTIALSGLIGMANYAPLKKAFSGPAEMEHSAPTPPTDPDKPAPKKKLSMPGLPPAPTEPAPEVPRPASLKDSPTEYFKSRQKTLFFQVPTYELFGLGQLLGAVVAVLMLFGLSIAYMLRRPYVRFLIVMYCLFGIGFTGGLVYFNHVFARPEAGRWSAGREPIFTKYDGTPDVDPKGERVLDAENGYMLFVGVVWPLLCAASLAIPGVRASFRNESAAAATIDDNSSA